MTRFTYKCEACCEEKEIDHHNDSLMKYFCKCGTGEPMYRKIQPVNISYTNKDFHGRNI